MKNKFKFITSFILFLIALSFAIIPNKISVSADSRILTANDFEDSFLFLYLSSLLEENEELSTNSFYIEDPSSQITVLDLSFKTVSQNFDDNVYFTSLKGLELLNLSTIKSLNVSGHNLTQVDLTTNSNSTFLPNLEYLNLENNNIEYLDAQYCSNLTTVKLNNNNLSNFENLKLPNNSITVNLYQNNLDIEQIPVTTNQINLGVQGVKNNAQYYKNAKLSFLPDSNTTKISIYKDGQSVGEIPYIENGELKYSKTLGYGNYELRYTLLEEATTTLDSVNFSINVQVPTLKFFQNESEISPVFRISKKTKITFEGEGTIYLIINGKTTQTNTVEISSYGNYTIQYYQEIDGYKSEIKLIHITSMINYYVQWIFIVVGIVLFVIAIKLVLVYINKPINGKLKKREKF